MTGHQPASSVTGHCAEHQTFTTSSCSTWRYEKSATESSVQEDFETGLDPCIFVAQGMSLPVQSCGEDTTAVRRAVTSGLFPHAAMRQADGPPPPLKLSTH